MPAEGPIGNRLPDEDRLSGEASVLVLDILDRNPSGFELQGLSSPSMYLVRARIDDDKINSPGINVETNSGSIGTLSEICL